jgi:replicative DNA helicase Mcm
MLIVDAMAGIPNDEGENNYMRYRINQLLIGDPGEAKSQLLRYNARLIPGGRYESAQSSTGLSLTAQVEREKDRFTLRLGPVPLARGSVCTLNEIDKMKDMAEQNHFLDTMEEGRFTINKYGRNYDIQSNTSIIASANPINRTWNHHDKINTNEIPIIEQLRQRCDIISIFRSPKSKAELTAYIWQKREVERNYASGLYNDYARLIRNWLKYVRSLPLPAINKEAEDMLDNYICNMGDKGITGIKRRRESLRRLIISRARLKMKNVADEDDAEETMKFYNVMLLHEQQAIAVSKRPEIETRDVCINILKKMKSFGGYAVKELMDAARKESITICGFR